MPATEIPKRSPATCGAASAKPEKLRIPPLLAAAGEMGTFWLKVLVTVRPVCVEPTSITGALPTTTTSCPVRVTFSGKQVDVEPQRAVHVERDGAARVGLVRLLLETQRVGAWWQLRDSVGARRVGDGDLFTLQIW